MKRLLIISVLLLLPIVTFSQKNKDDIYFNADKDPTTNIDIKDLFRDGQKYIYCQLLGKGRLFSNKVNVEIDFGQARKLVSDKRLKGNDGKPIKFNSMVDAMNFMGADGWEFVQAYVVTIGNQNVYHWLLKLDVEGLSSEEREDIFNKINPE